MVAGGVSGTGADVGTGVEVISLDESNVPLPDCLNQLQDFSDYVTYYFGGAPLGQG